MGMNMGIPQEEVETTKPSRRKRFGRMVFLLGLALIVIDIITSLLISIVAAYSGLGTPIANVEYLHFLLVVSGILLLFAGFAAALLPEGPSDDGIWIMKMGPIVGNP